MKYILLITLLSCQLILFARKDSTDNREIAYPRNYIAFGFADRMATPVPDRYRIKYFNESVNGNDTFSSYDRIESSSHLVNFMMSFALSKPYGGFKFDLGIVPFANRNYHLGASAFGLIPVSKSILISPAFGYTRFRKQKKIGELSRQNGNITFQNEQFSELSIRALDVWHSYNYGIGAYFNLSENVFLHLECRNNKVFKVRNRIKVSGYNHDGNETFLESITSPDQVATYSHADDQAEFRDAKNNVLGSFFKLNNLAFSIQLVLTLGDSGY